MIFANRLFRKNLNYLYVKKIYKNNEKEEDNKYKYNIYIDKIEKTDTKLNNENVEYIQKL